MFTKEEINEYADQLLIGLTDEECTMIQSEFDLVSKNSYVEIHKAKYGR